MNLNWNHILDKQPAHREKIIHLDCKFEGKYMTMGIRDYYQSCTFQEILDFHKNHNLELDFWWISYKDFPFPKDKEI